MRNWSIPVGRIFGIEIRVHLTFFFLLMFVWSLESNLRGNWNAWRGLALVGVIFASVLLHEFGHAIVAARHGVPAKAIILLPIGGVTLLNEAALISESGEMQPAKTWKRDIRIALAGPVVNLVLAALSAFVIMSLWPQVDLAGRPFLTGANLPRSLVWTNICLALFNLLPAYPLDGGRVLRAILNRRMDTFVATRRAVSIGQLFAVLLMLFGMLRYMQTNTLSSAWLAMIGFFLFLGAQMEERSAIFHSVLETVRLEEIMLTDFATLSPADTLEDALDKAVHTLQDDFPVVRGSDLVGVISKQKILEALRLEGNGYVQSVMNRASEASVKTESLAAAFRKLTARGLTLIPVVEDQHLVGIVTLQNLMHSMALLAESRKLRRSLVD
jgi:Zn-dependent protease